MTISPISVTRGGLRLGLAAAVLLTLAASTLVQAGVRERPYYGRTPAYVCFKSTLTPEGQLKQNKIIRSSGAPVGDRHARNLVTKSYFTENTGLQGEERDVHVLVRVYANGKFTLRLFEMDEPLPAICTTPYVDPRDKK